MRPQNQRVVVTGIGAVSPNGVGREAFWAATRAGRSGVGEISLFDPADLQVRIAGEVRGFDETAFVDKNSRAHVARTVAFARAAAGEALADAGLAPDEMGVDALRRVGVVVGSGGGSQAHTEKQYTRYFEGREKEASVYSVPTGTIGSVSSEISMPFGLRGPSHVVSTGCSSSTDAMHYAAQWLRDGSLDAVVTGGVDAPISYLIIRGFQLMRILTRHWNHAPEEASRPFSADRSGFVLGEGAWMFVLEPLDKAQARGAAIYGEVAGYGSTCEAFHRVRMRDNGEEPARAIQLALEQAGIAPEDVGYAALHGTSTELNDRVETAALHQAFGRAAPRIPGSSIKSMIGHPQGASGAAGIAATLLAMRDGVLPPTVNLTRADAACDLDYVPDVGRRAEVEWAVCNCIAFGSKNSALVLRRLA